MADTQHVSGDEISEFIEEEVHQIGESVVALTQPLTEGIIISRDVSEEGRLELTLMMAPYRKKGHAWTRASLITKDAARLSKRIPSKFMFPIQDKERIKTEAKRAKADPTWIFSVLSDLDQKIPEHSTKPLDTSEFESGCNKDEEEDTDVPKERRQSAILEDRLKEGLTLKDDTTTRKYTKKKSTLVSSDTEESDFEYWQRKRKSKKKQKKKKSSRKASSSSSSYSSSSSSEDSDQQGEVYEKGDSGLFSCPFHKSDSRGFKDVQIQIKGKSLSRKYVRTALHNFYAESYSLASFADKLVYTASSSPFKPYASDVAWLQLHAKYLNAILLNSLYGAWVLWNEPWLDDIVIAFLELAVRVSPYKEYPVCLEEKVIKWMKKQRIGISPRYGPVSYAMQHAKFTDGGLIVTQNNQLKQKENKSNVPPFAAKASGKAPPSHAAEGDKKP